MKNNKRKEQTSISTHLTKSYLMVYPLFIAIFLIVVLFGTFVSSDWLQGSSIQHQYRAEALLRSNIQDIETSEIVKLDGGVAVVFEDGRVQELGGRRLFKKSALSRSEWTDFLANVSNPEGKYVYSVAYSEEGFWLLVGFPVSVRIRLSVATNAEATGYTKALTLYISALIILLALLFIGSWIYAKHSAKAFINPLRKLCGMVKRIARGQYEVEEIEDLTGEFLWLKGDICKLSAELSHEKHLREKLEKDKKQMLLDISHDLRNPLATMMGYAEALSSSDIHDEEQRARYANIIYRNSIRANDLINDLFMYTKLDHAEHKVLLSRGDICEFMREQILQFLSEFEAEGIETDFNIPKGEIFIPFDHALLQRAFANLISNCIVHNPKGTKLTIHLKDGHDAVQILVADDGIGMEAVIAENVFEPFVRSDQSRNSKTGGSGLGLAIALKIIKAHNGNIELDTAPGEGCRFIVTLKKK